MLIENITNNMATNKAAAMFYKVEPFYTDVSRYVHTNNWEILQAIKILNEKGFSVDLIDRNNTNWSTKKKYDLFLGLGVGGAGVNFPKHAKTSGAPVKILLSMGPQPDVSARLVHERYDAFNKRTGKNVPTMRSPTMVCGKKWLEIVEATDYIFNIGEKNNKSYNSFLPYSKPVINFFPSTSPKVQFQKDWLRTRDQNNYLCFAGNGFICKGVDLAVEAFLKDKSKNLHICGPSSEAGFFQHYKSLIDNAPNIKYHGFIEPGGETFNKLASVCSYVIFHSSAEGCCTSVATAMRAGLVPIINEWTGINITDEGFLLNESGNLVQNIYNTMQESSQVTEQKYKKLVERTLTKSALFSQESFTDSYRKAIDLVIKKEKTLQ
jgi:glycosyltransferase involved in cell wall biosynthesis